MLLHVILCQYRKVEEVIAENNEIRGYDRTNRPREGDMRSSTIRKRVYMLINNITHGHDRNGIGEAKELRKDCRYFTKRIGECAKNGLLPLQ